MAGKTPRNADELKAQIEADELTDLLQAARYGFAKVSVREFAKAKGLQPQLIYYYIRRGYIKEEPCSECGRKVVDIKSAEDYLASKEKDDPRRAQNVDG
jgi:hypothetical protein